MDSGITNNNILNICAKDGLVSTTLLLMREANLQEWTCSVMNSYKMKVGRIIKEEERLAKHRQQNARK